MEPLKNRIQGTHGTPLSMGKASGRMHHHDKHAATKDGHRADDPHAVTGNTFPPSGWKQDEINAQAAGARRAIRTTERANAADMDALTQRHSEIQAVLDEPNIQREGHEVFDEGTDYGQRVSAFGNVERDVSDEQGGGYDVQGDEMVDLTEGEEDQAFAKVGIYGQEMPPPPPPPPRQSHESEQAHIAANTQGFGPEETRWRAGQQEEENKELADWRKRGQSPLYQGENAPPNPPPESRFTPDGETKIPAPPRQDGRPHQRTPSDADRAKAGPPPPPPKSNIPPPPPPPR